MVNTYVGFGVLCISASRHPNVLKGIMTHPTVEIRPHPVLHHDHTHPVLKEYPARKGFISSVCLSTKTLGATKVHNTIKGIHKFDETIRLSVLFVQMTVKSSAMVLSTASDFAQLTIRLIFVLASQ